MKIYRINLYDYEESLDYEFLHPENKTEKQFEEDIKLCIQKAKDDIFIYDDGEPQSWIGTTNVFDCAVKYMFEIGYSLPEYQMFSLPSTGVITTAESRDPNGRIEECFGKELIDKILKHNTDIERELCKRYGIEYGE